MAYDQSANIRLYLLRAENFSEKSAPNQKQFYREAAGWLQENHFDSAEEAREAMMQTKYYAGAGLAKIADDIALRANAMEEVAYDDVADIHRQREEKFSQRGYEYAYSQEWIDDLQLASKESEKYARRKEIFGRIFSGYFQIAGNPQSEHRKTAARNLAEALQELDQMGVNFEELALERAYQELTMTTGEGMRHFVEFIRNFRMSGMPDTDDLSDISDEQNRIANWVKTHKQELIEAGKSEKWHHATCVAVPSDAEGGYDFIAMKEVDENGRSI